MPDRKSPPQLIGTCVSPSMIPCPRAHLRRRMLFLEPASREPISQRYRRLQRKPRYHLMRLAMFTSKHILSRYTSWGPSYYIDSLIVPGHCTQVFNFSVLAVGINSP
jgi:hypothetical protein